MSQRLIKVLFVILGCHSQFAAASSLGFAEVNETTLYYEVKGEGHPLVLISGGGSLDTRMWDDQFETFAQYYKVIRYDIRGIGKSEIPRGPYSAVKDLHALMEFLAIKKAHILGLSFGSRIAVDFALEHPNMVAALLAAAPGLSGYGDDNQLAQSLQVLASEFRENGFDQAIEIVLVNPYLPESPVPRRRIRAILSDNAHTFYLGFPNISLMKSPSPPTIERLSEIRVPTLILVGDRDHQEIVAISDLLQEGISGAKKVIVLKAGHIINMDNVEDFNRAVLDFLNGLQEQNQDLPGVP